MKAKKQKLRCEDPNNAEGALTALMADCAPDGDVRGFNCVFEHGQLWIQHNPCGASWSVNDGGDAIGNECFVFDRIDQGDEECDPEEHE